MIDTHSHIYLDDFDADRQLVIERAKKAGIEKILLPNVDTDTLERMHTLAEAYCDYCFPMLGLHPTSVDDSYEKKLSFLRKELEHKKYIAIGEIGLDLYWDKTFFEQQVVALKKQLEWSLEFNLPFVIHMRDSFDALYKVMSDFKNSGLRGVFHSFTGDIEQASKLLDLGDIKLGINGVITFKNSSLGKEIMNVPLDKIVLETDAPYLTPTPFRGKRNESAYLVYVLEKITEIYSVSKEAADKITTQNANAIFFKN